MPEEYIDYLLMNHFRCLPGELDKEDNARLLQFLEIRGIAKKIQNDEIKKEQQKAKSKQYGRH